MQPLQREPDRDPGFKAELQRARKHTERLINTRDRSSSELGQRLKKAGFSSEVIAREVEEAVASGLVDDQRFMQLYIQGKTRSGWGQNRIVAELRRFGIDLRHCDGYPDSFFTAEDELDRALECLNRFHTSSKDPWNARYRRLLSKGYTRETAQTALKTLTIQQGRNTI